jgi:hypothetical protein
VTAPRAPLVREPHEQSHDHECGQRPCRRDADAAVVATAKTLEELVVYGLRFAVGDEERGAAE